MRAPDKWFWIWLPVRLLIPVALVLFYVGYPAARENAPGACAALAQRAYASVAVSPTGLGRRVSAAFGGPLIEAKVEQDNPNIPPALVCATLYYEAISK